MESYQFETHINRFEDSDLWHFYIMVPDAVVHSLKPWGNRVVCTVNGHFSFQTAVLSAGERGYFININKDIRTKLDLNVNDELTIALTPDTSRYGLPVPEAFSELLQQDPEFEAVFHHLTLGKQRTLIYMISKFKTEVKQLEKLMILRNYLVSVKGKLDYKELNQAFKDSKK